MISATQARSSESFSGALRGVRTNHTISVTAAIKVSGT